MKRRIEVGSVWRHFNGIHYAEVVCIATDTETKQKSVVYKCFEHGAFHGIFARPYDMFLSEVDAEKYPEHKGEYRFTKVTDGH